MGTHLQDPKLRGGGSGNDDSKQVNTSVKSSFLKTHPSKSANHDVFLSFLGEDTGRNFVDHLHSALEEEEILTYMHRESNLSDQLHSETMKTIEESRISIIVFSKNYARSSKCMDELAYIMKCMDVRKHRVVPVFYHVDTPNVRNQRGDFEQVFSKHESINPSKVELRRKALRDASNLSGWDIQSHADG
ncbi:disease resistance protein RPV1-like [Bidens hawaiensis]|uniref:disease resistance protein RPV1-like n=1 Tax=Bidens hawaiensis TaxID=980011 RepID=UPI00404A0FAC